MAATVLRTNALECEAEGSWEIWGQRFKLSSIRPKNGSSYAGTAEKALFKYSTLTTSYTNEDQWRFLICYRSSDECSRFDIVADNVKFVG
jgi:hypothetical protein